MERIAQSNLIESHWEAMSEVDGAAQAKSTVAREVPDSLEQTARGPKLWAVGGGKGGVGKSLISANVSIAMARQGRQVIVVDLDLGGANLHTCLGLSPPAIGIGDWVSGRTNDLKELLISTGEARLRMISGAPDPLRIINLIAGRAPELVKQLRELDADDIILDLGAGTHELTIEFFLAADQGIISMLPEPTSVENAYRFIRAALYTKLRATDIPDGVREVIDAASDPKNVLGIRTPADLLAIVERLDPISYLKLKEEMKQLSPQVVINQVRSQTDTDIGKAVCSVCRRYFGLEVGYAGYLDYDNSVWKAVRQKKSVLKEYPHSILSNRIEKLARILLGEEEGIS